MHALAIAASMLLTAHPHKTKVAVLDVQDVSGNQAANARALTQIVTGEVSRDGSLDVISSEQIRQMLGFERQKQLLGCSEGSCLAEIGGALGVDDLITGQLAKLGSRYRLDLTLVDQSRARTAATVGEFLPADEDALSSVAVRLVNDLLVKAGLRTSAQAALDRSLAESAPISHTGAYVGFGIAAALLASAGIMTAVTSSTYGQAVTEYRVPGVTTSNPGPNGQKLRWMGPLTDGLWGGAIVAAGTGTLLYFTAKSSGSGGEIAVGGSF